MNTFKARSAVGALVATLALASLGGCAMGQGEAMGAPVDDAGIAAAVKARMEQSGEVGEGAIQIQAKNGIVMLSGHATSERERRAAHHIARSVDGVQGVRSTVRVRS